MLVIFLLFQIFAFDVHVCHSGIQAGFEGKVCISYGQADIRKKRQTSEYEKSFLRPTAEAAKLSGSWEQLF